MPVARMAPAPHRRTRRVRRWDWRRSGAGGPDSPPEAIAIMAADPDHLMPAADAPDTLALLPVRNTVLFPGVVLLQEILHCLSQKSGLKLWRVAAAKFHRPVTGGCVLTLWTDAPAATVPVGTPIRFELRRLDAVVVSGQVEAGAAAP